VIKYFVAAKVAALKRYNDFVKEFGKKEVRDRTREKLREYFIEQIIIK
jgi:hypothetical protein